MMRGSARDLASHTLFVNKVAETCEVSNTSFHVIFDTIHRAGGRSSIETAVGFQVVLAKLHVRNHLDSAWAPLR